MDKQSGPPSHSVLLAGAAFFVSVCLFAAAFFLFDGMSLVAEIMGQVRQAVVPDSTHVAAGPSPVKLELPAGMPEEFALRLWQEQIDSQEMLQSLAEGDIKSLTFSRVETVSAEATMSVVAFLSDGVDLPGVIGLRRFGDSWFVAYASAFRNGQYTRRPQLHPQLRDVDVALLNTIVEHQARSQSVFDEYLAGTVHEIRFTKWTHGPNTVTIDCQMEEDHGTGLARIVLVSQQGPQGSPTWFLTRFMKIGDIPKS